MVASTNVIRLNEFDTYALLPLESRVAGTYIKTLVIVGNSLLSTVFVKSIAGSVKVNYYEYTTGRDDSERKELPSHLLITAPNTANPSKITTTPFHNTVVLEVIVTGTAEFSVYTTVVASFATDLDAALQLDGQIAVLTEDKGMPFMCYDPDAGKFFFIRCVDGVIPTSSSEAGDPFFADGLHLPTSGSETTVATFIVPAGTTRKLIKVQINSFHPGSWTILDGASIIGSGKIHPGHPESIFEWSRRREIAALSTITLKYTARGGQTASDVRYHIMGSDIT